MEIYAFGIFTGIIIVIFAMLILGLIENNDKGNNKKSHNRNRSGNNNIDVFSGRNRRNNRYDIDNEEEVIDDLICCHMIGLF